MDDQLTLWCLDYGETATKTAAAKIFQIKVSPTDYVSDMRDHIKKKRDRILKGIDADDLVLWKLREPLLVDDNFEDNIKQMVLLDQAEEMVPLRCVSRIFPEKPSMKHLHIIVQVFDVQLPTSVVMKDDIGSEAFIVARALHHALWGTEFESLLHDSGEPSLKYLRVDQFHPMFQEEMFPEDILLVRDEYKKAFSVMEDWQNEGKSGAVVTGQPGIGKTCFLFYVLFRRLAARLPTALQIHKSIFFLFTQQGAFIFSTSSHYRIPRGTWALADSNSSVVQPCEAFLATGARDVWVLQTTAPEASRWKKWRKHRSAKLFIMDHMSPKELGVLGSLLNLDTQKLLSHFRTWGPSTRVCIQLERGDISIDEMQSNAAFAASKFVTDPMFIIGSVASLNFEDDIPSILFTIRPGAQKGGMVPVMQIASNHILGIIARHAADGELARQRNLFSTLTGHPALKDPAGWYFEKYVHIRLTAHTSNDPLEALPANPSSPPLVIPVCRNVVALSGKDGMSHANQQEPMVYWRPTSQSFTSFDAIICTPKTIILLQATVAEKHGIKQDCLDFIRQSIPAGYGKERDWCLVFVTDTEQNAQILRNQSFLSKLTLGDLKLHVYSSIFEIGQSALSHNGKAELERITNANDDEGGMEMELDGEQ